MADDKKVDTKGPLQKLKDKILPDEDEQAAIISTFVRLGVLVWSGGVGGGATGGGGVSLVIIRFSG